MRKFATVLTLFFVFLGTSTFSNYIEAQSSESAQKKQTKYKKARALSSATAKKMGKIGEALDRVDEDGKASPDLETVIEILTELRNMAPELKSYDRSVMWNYWAYLYLEEEKYELALDAYRKVIAEPEVTLGLRNAALLVSGQLNVSLGNTDLGISQLLEYISQVEKVTAQAYYFLSNAYYTQDEWRKSINSIEKAIKLAEDEGYKPKENWYIILAGCLGNLKAEIGEKESLLRRLEVYEILVNLYPKKTYFLQLGGIYSQLDREKDYMITLKAAHAKDFLDKEGEYKALAQLLLINKNPYWAANVLESGRIKKVTIVDKETKEEKVLPVVPDNAKNLKLLADAWRMAQEFDRAIPILEKSAELSKDGESYVLLGNLLVSVDRTKEAIEALKQGIKKGGLKKKSQAYLSLGQAYFEIEQFDEAKKTFRIAARDDDKVIKKQANSWLKYTENEEYRVKNLALRRDFIQNNS
tara:strand:- start:4841 stop:6250 length:1410 start_codon:yes stop_codon:yes gene_type:complete